MDTFVKRRWNLYEMLKTYARNFVELEQSLSVVEAIFNKHAERVEDAEGWQSMLDHVLRRCTEIGLNESGKQVTRLVRKLRAGVKNEELARDVNSLRERIMDELEDRAFYYVNKECVDLYNAKEPFGANVASKLPSAISDIEEAGKCLAMGRYTACVFHLMRVMEASVKALATSIGVSNPGEKAWGPLTNEIHGKLLY